MHGCALIKRSHSNLRHRTTHQVDLFQRGAIIEGVILYLCQGGAELHSLQFKARVKALPRDHLEPTPDYYALQGGLAKCLNAQLRDAIR